MKWLFIIRTSSDDDFGFFSFKNLLSVLIIVSNASTFIFLFEQLLLKEQIMERLVKENKTECKNGQ